jgi:hypothetical protein
MNTDLTEGNEGNEGIKRQGKIMGGIANLRF